MDKRKHPTDQRQRVRIREAVDVIRGEIVEASDGQRSRRIVIREALTAGVVNRNGRRYTEQAVRAAVQELQPKLRESAGQGRAILHTADGDPLVGEADHPSDKGGRPALLETVVVWTDVAYDEASRAVSLTGTIADTQRGRDIQALADIGLLPGGSLRGNGISQVVDFGEGQVEEVVELHLTGYDLVLTPSFQNTAVIESKQDALIQPAIQREEKPQMDIETVRKALGLAESATEADILSAAARAREAAVQLEETKKRDALTRAIDEACKGLPYDAALNAQFRDELAEDAADASAVAARANKLRKRYDQLAAASALKSQGYSGPLAGIQVAPVFEKETGQPAYARLSHDLAESVMQHRGGQLFNAASPRTANERVAAAVLKRFDELHGAQLQREAQLYAEAHTATDLTLPYTISRTINSAVFPSLVATSVFDTALMQNSPEYLYYESYAEETGLTATVTDEVVAAPATLGNTSALAAQRVIPGTVVVTNSAGSTTYTEGTDYTVDYANGLVFFPASGGAITASQSLKIDYQYKAIRKGENAAIERSKNTLSRISIEAKADRLAVEITNEAVVFGRSQLGYDVAARAVANMTNEINRIIDQGLIRLAIQAVKAIASNSGGTWTVGSTPDYSVGVSTIGKAKVKVLNRNYQPTFALMSATNSDLIANWTGFSASGLRPDGAINPAGFVGRVKGLDVFETTQMTDTEIIVGNRELVMFRIFQPLLVKGPFPSYDSNKLKANDQWYIEGFNASAAPVPQKGAYMVVA
jgi:hypothetical protein